MGDGNRAGTGGDGHWPLAASRGTRRGPFVAGALAATALAVLLPLGAGAEELPVVTVVDLSEDDAAAREIAHDVVLSIRRSDKLRYRDVAETLNTGAEDLHVSNVRSADATVRETKAKLEARQYAEAAEELETAVTNYLSSFAFKEDQEEIARAMVLYAACLLMAGEAGSARAAFERAVEFRPKAEHDLAAWPPKVAQALDKARQAVGAREKVSFEVRTDPPHAEVFVNGVYAGLSPAFVSRTGGTQYVRVVKQGYVRVGRALKLEGTEGNGVDIELEAARRKPAFDGVKQRLGEVFEGAVEPNDLTELNGLVTAQLAVLAQATGTREKMKVRLALANLGGRQVINRVEADVVWLRRDKEAVDKLVDRLFAPPEIPPDSKEPAVRTRSILTRWWFWTVVGGVALGSTAIYLLASDTEAPPPPYKQGEGGLVIKF